MNILEHIKQELPWLDGNTVYDLTRGKPAPEQLDITENYYSKLSTPYELDLSLIHISEPTRLR